MKLFRTLFVILLVIGVPLTSFALEPPKIVTEAMDAYKKSGYEEAFKIWMRGSPLEDDKTSYMNIRGAFTQIETAYGKMVGYEIVKSVSISPSTIRTYAVILYQKGPLFVFFDCYNSLSGWIISQIQFNTKPNLVFPDILVSGEVK
jgi:hypothetical protein